MLGVMFKSFLLPLHTAIGVTVFLLGAVALRAGKIEVYEIPKEHAGHSHSGNSNPHGGTSEGSPHGGAPMAQPSIKVGKQPEGWRENPTPGAMRAASYLVSNAEGTEAEMAVIPVPGMANIELQLVNMWREQAKLPAITEADLGTQSTAVTIAGEQGKLFDVASTEAVLGGKYKARILVAMLKRDDFTWFFKLTGEDAFVASQKANFLSYLKDVSFEAPQLPAGHPPMAGGGGGMGMGIGQGMMGGGATVPPGTGDQPKWTIPAGWTEIARSPFLVGKFQVTGDGGAKADINVSMSAGDGGGLLANVNRWRGQLSLGSVDEAGLQKISAPLELAGLKATLVDFAGEGAENGNAMRCVGAIVSQSGQTWFFKLLGDATLVAREKEALVTFVRSVKF